MNTVPDITLNNGVTIPQVGYGVFQIPPQETQRGVAEAFAAGYRHIDTAAAYGNEAGVGAAIRDSGLAREDIFITTKLRNGEHGYDNALRAFDNSRRQLDLDVIDLYLIHWPAASRDAYVETWRAFEHLAEQGKVRAIGVSNFLPEHLDRLLSSCEVVPAVNQIELHPTFQQPATDEASRAAGIAVEAYSPLGQAKDLNDATVVAIAERHEKSPAQVVLRWHMQRGRILIPKSVTPSRIATNIDLGGFSLSEEELAAIDDLDTAERIGGDPATVSFSQMD